MVSSPPALTGFTLKHDRRLLAFRIGRTSHRRSNPSNRYNPTPASFQEHLNFCCREKTALRNSSHPSTARRNNKTSVTLQLHTSFLPS